MIPHVRWHVAGRRVQPFSLAVTLSLLTLTWAFSANLAVGSMLDGLPGDILAALSLLAALLLGVGWWRQSAPMHAHGMLLGAGVWAGTSAILITDVGWTVSTALALCWLVACGGAWLIETDAHRAGR